MLSSFLNRSKRGMSHCWCCSQLIFFKILFVFTPSRPIVETFSLFFNDVYQIVNIDAPYVSRCTHRFIYRFYVLSAVHKSTDTDKSPVSYLTSIFVTQMHVKVGASTFIFFRPFIEILRCRWYSRRCL